MENNIKIAYFSAEIGIDEKIKTFSGGLGILAGDTIKAMADLKKPVCAVTLLYKKGFFKQKISEDFQVEEADYWDFQSLLKDTGKFVNVNILNQNVKVKIWQLDYFGAGGGKVTIYFLDTDLNENPQFAKEITQRLYVGDRISQEIILGIGGVRALFELGHTNIERYHMNEGHSAFLTLELYKNFGESGTWSDELVKEKCVFTTHTPIPAGHDKFEYGDFYNKLSGEKNLIPLHIRKLAGDEKLNMTKLAISLSNSTNGVSRKHMEVTKKMFPFNDIKYVTNGVHMPTWVSPHLAKVYDKHLKGWRKDSTKLKGIFNLDCSLIEKAHQKAKIELIDFVNKNNICSSTLDPNVLTIGFARRFIGYKDAELIFKDISALKRLGKKVQFIFAGKSHMDDGIGKAIMKRIIDRGIELKDFISIAFVENYDIYISKKLVSGCDLWLNTPIPFNEASGTSGMKASGNGCMHFSRLDGWAIESFEKNGGGFPIYEYEDFIINLEYKIIPMFYGKDRIPWFEQMKLSIGNGASYFNTHRMVEEYFKNIYKLK